MERRQAGDARFHGGQAVRVEHRDIGDAVGAGAGGNRFEALRFGLGRCDDDLAAFVDGDVVGGGEFAQQRHPATAQGRLETARLVVETGVDDPGVVTGLMGGRPVLLLVQGDLGTIIAAEDLTRDGGADDAGTDDGVSLPRTHGRSSSRGVADPNWSGDPMASDRSDHGGDTTSANNA